LFTALTVGAALFAITYGAAASLGGVTVGNMGADAAPVSSCDTDGVNVNLESFSEDPSAQPTLVGLLVNHVADACVGHRVVVIVSDGSSSAAGDGTVQAGTAGNNFAHVTFISRFPIRSIDNLGVLIF